MADVSSSEEEEEITAPAVEQVLLDLRECEVQWGGCVQQSYFRKVCFVTCEYQVSQAYLCYFISFTNMSFVYCEETHTICM
jgi:hypothetical protein